MRLVITQPSYWPWLTYLRRVARADLFVCLDHVELDRSSKTNYVNRAKVLNAGKEAWLTIPIDHGESRRICDLKPVSNDKRPWERGHHDLLMQAYRYHPHVKEVIRDASYAWRASQESPATVCQAVEYSMDLAFGWFGIDTDTVYTSAMPEFHQYKGSELILELCKYFGATEYIAGSFAKSYLDVGAFAEEGIALEYDTWQAAPYTQLGVDQFVGGLSCIDAVMNHGNDCKRLLEL